MKTKNVIRKSFVIRESGRSTDFISPSFINECGLNCSYCYVKRHNRDEITIAKNANEILTAINNHVYFLPKKEPNQTDVKYWTYDISCNSDFAFHRKQLQWEYIFDFFKQHQLAKASLATKIIPLEFLNYSANKKIRIRFSLMPQKYSSILEPNTPSILDRIKAIDTFIDAGYEVHINYSPIIVTSNWLDRYKELFELVDTYVDNKDEVLAECIFLTHHGQKHIHNLENKLPGEELIWRPAIQETKRNQFGGFAIRYKSYLKHNWVTQFKKLHNEIVPWNKIRYIF